MCFHTLNFPQEHSLLDIILTPVIAHNLMLGYSNVELYMQFIHLFIFVLF